MNSFWDGLPARLRNRLSLTLGAVLLLAMSLCSGLIGLSRGPNAYASIPTRPPALHPGVKPMAMATAAPPPTPMVALQDLTPEQALAANQAVPFSTLPNPPAKPFKLTGAADADRTRAETCLAQAVYYEAGFEPLAGEQAVAQVVLNRVRHPVYPKTVCGVVFQGSELKTGCQFTFTCDGALDRPPEAVAWARALAVARAALDGFVAKPVGEATHYHTQYVAPYWSPSLVKLTQIGQHIFYRWTGAFGQPPAFAGQYAGNEPGAATPPAGPMQLLPIQKLAVDYAAAQPSAPGSSGAAATHPDADAAPSAANEALPASSPAVAPVRLARADVVAPVDTAPIEAVPVQKIFVPAQSLVPRPKWKPF